MLHKQSRTWTIFLIFRSKRAAGDSPLWMCSSALPFSVETVPLPLRLLCYYGTRTRADRRSRLCAVSMLFTQTILQCLRPLLLFCCLLHVLTVRSAPLDLGQEDSTIARTDQNHDVERRAFLHISSVSIVTSTGGSFGFYLLANIHCLLDKYQY
jgi:hypothetical protein